MKYKKKNNQILIDKTKDFNIKQILECGQIFRFKEKDNIFDVFSLDKKAIVFETNENIIIETEDVNYFETFFDFKTDYAVIKQQLLKDEIMQKAINFASGVRILKQDPFEMVISFIISANNNIKRIKMIVENICTHFGTNMGDYFAFPTIEQLLNTNVEDFKKMGAGYRAEYLYKVVRQLENYNLESLSKLNENECANELIKMAGVGPKVADCVMLFAFGKQRVFPVDTWIEKVFNLYFNKENKKLNRNEIRKELVKKFDNLSGYAQQYLFYYQRELKI